MRAAVCVRAGGPEVLEIREMPVPAVREGWSLVQVKGAGLNRSELRTRQGHSPNVTFPRVLGIECVGIVAASTDPALPDGTTVAAVMGEMGREFDGGYAEYALLPNSLLMPVTTTLAWDVLAALPETYLTAQGSLDALGVGPGSRLLIRGGTSSVGLAAASIASGHGIEIAATTRRPEQDRRVDRGRCRPRTRRRRWVAGGERARRLARRSGLRSGSRRGEHRGGLAAPGPPGRDGVRGGLAQRVVDPELRTDSDDPVRNQAHGLPQRQPQGQRGRTVLQRVVHEVEAGVYRPNIDRVFGLDDIVAAHHYMENNRATGKLVVVP